MTHMTLPLRHLTYPQLHTHIARDLTKIRQLAKAIAKDGLLNPIRVKRQTRGDTVNYRIIDGRKRFAAIRLLTLMGKRPRSLTRIPCIEIKCVEIKDKAANLTPLRPTLKTDAEFAKAVSRALGDGQKASTIIQRFACQLSDIEAVQLLPKLHLQIRDYFNSGHISLEQAAAFATIPDEAAQWRLLQELGPFAHAKDVIAAIAKGETVLALPDGNVMILPSRKVAISMEMSDRSHKQAA